MNYEKIILEMFVRIQELETTVSLLEQRLTAIEREDNICNDAEENKKVTTQDKIKRSEARQNAIDIIKEFYQEKNYEPYVAKRDEGSGIRVDRLDDDDYLLIKFYYSKTFPRQSGKYDSGWHVVDAKEIRRGSHYSIHLFSMVDSKGEWHYFMFTQQELHDYFSNQREKEYNDDLWRLQFSVQDGVAYELREDQNPITEHYNNWSKLGQLQGIKFN
jgi:hypothetical protein